MASPTDPNQVRLTGENPFIRMSADANGPEITRASYWRVLLSPGGGGHALFLKSDVTDGQTRVYADNIALARYLQEEIESLLTPEFAEQSLQVIDAEFYKSGDAMTAWTETVESEEDSISLTWYDFMEPFVLHYAPDEAMPGMGVYSTFVPARRAQLTLNGAVAGGKTLPDKRGDWESTTSCLAWSETWVRPK